MISFLTSIIGLVAKGQSAKAIAGGVVPAVLFGVGPLIESFQSGLMSGAGNSFEQLGIAVGQTLAGFITGYIITWLSPKNKE